jgi:hypothetical protein
MKLFLKKTVIALTVIGILPVFASAQTTTVKPISQNFFDGWTCYNIKNDYSFGQKQKKGDVSIQQIQMFLMFNKYIKPMDTSNYFGAVVRDGLKKFQTLHYLKVTGTLNKETRAKIKSLTCQSDGESENGTAAFGSEVSVDYGPDNSTVYYQTSVPPIISSFTDNAIDNVKTVFYPTETLTIFGTNLETRQLHTVITDKKTEIKEKGAANGPHGSTPAVVFDIPRNTPPGIYKLQIKNEFGVSNAMRLEIQVPKDFKQTIVTSVNGLTPGKVVTIKKGGEVIIKGKNLPEVGSVSLGNVFNKDNPYGVGIARDRNSAGVDTYKVKLDYNPGTYRLLIESIDKPNIEIGTLTITP